jgi:hypothetical protein
VVLNSSILIQATKALRLSAICRELQVLVEESLAQMED